MDFIKENWPIISLIFLIAGVTWKSRGWVSSIENDIGDLKKSVRKIEGFLKSLFPSTTSTNSPINLTDLGKKVSQEIQASEWAKQTAPGLIVQVEGKSHYDIQEYCFEHVKRESVLTEEMDERVRSSAYNNGIEKWQVLRVLAIELRDTFFEQLKMDKNADY
ncbi:MAG: hypothetical protein F4X55_04175 [Candidatus Dadabacteria bacterium]|nr:hypothetical protein [Candidatus Dadabacteria bacterium]